MINSGGAAAPAPAPAREEHAQQPGANPGRPCGAGPRSQADLAAVPQAEPGESRAAIAEILRPQKFAPAGHGDVFFFSFVYLIATP